MEHGIEPRLEFAFQIEVKFASRTKIGLLPSGVRRGFTPTSGGEISGPRLQGHVVPDSGGDWASWWPNGVVEFNAQYMLDFLANAAEGPIRLELKDEQSAGQLRPMGDETFRYRYVIMPMRI